MLALAYAVERFFESVEFKLHSSYTLIIIFGAFGFFSGFSFVINSRGDRRCLGVSAPSGKMISSDFQLERALVLLPCERSAALEWNKLVFESVQYFHRYSCKFVQNFSIIR